MCVANIMYISVPMYTINYHNLWENCELGQNGKNFL